MRLNNEFISMIHPVKNISIFIVSISVCALSNNVAQAEIITSVNSGSWNDTSVWSNNQTPSASNDYIITSGITVKAPIVSASGTFSRTFAGGSLTVSNGGALSLPNESGGNVSYINYSIPGLYLENNASLVLHAKVGNTNRNLGTPLTVADTGAVYIDIGGASSQYNNNITFTPGASISGGADIVATIDAWGLSHLFRKYIQVNSANNTYSGNWYISSTNIIADDRQGALIALAENALGTGEVVLKKSYLVNSVDGGLNSLSGVTAGEYSVVRVNGDWQNPNATLDLTTKTSRMEIHGDDTIVEIGNLNGVSGSKINSINRGQILGLHTTEQSVYHGTINGTLNLIKSGEATLVLTGDNTYYDLFKPATTIEAGTLQLGNGGTSGSILGDVVNNGNLAFNRSDEVVFEGVISGTGTVSQIGTGTTILTAENTYSGRTNVLLGVLEAGAIDTFSPNSYFFVTSGTFLNLSGYSQTVLELNNAGTVDLRGNPTPGTVLTVSQNYDGQNGILELFTELGDDSSPTDKLVVHGSTDGVSSVRVTNAGGLGALTTEGIEIISVDGESEGQFNLIGDYEVYGHQTVVGGAYSYLLLKGNYSGTETKNWYLRSNVCLSPEDPEIPSVPEDPEIPGEPGDPEIPGEPGDPGAPTEPEYPSIPSQPAPQQPCEPDNIIQLYQAGVPDYETYPQALLGLNGVNTLQQRVANRFWAGAGNRVIAEGADAIVPYAAPEEAGVHVDGNGVWGRIEGAHSSINPRFSTSTTDFDQNVFKMQAGVDGLLTETENGMLIGGVFVQYVHGKTKVSSFSGDGEISTDGYGFGGTLTWYGNEGFYIDSQAQVTWYNSDLNSILARRSLTDGNDGIGYALSIESGKRFAINPEWSVTPQAQLVYSSVDFDDFTDTFKTPVSLEKGDSLQGRLGLTLDHENSWQNAKGLMNRSHVYGIANLYYEFLDGTRVDVAGVSFASKKDRLWGGIGIGGSYNWDNDKYSIYGEGIVNTSLNDLGDSYSLKGNVGLKVKW